MKLGTVRTLKAFFLPKKVLIIFHKEQTGKSLIFGLHLVVLRVLDTEYSLAICKASTVVPVVLSLWPFVFKFLLQIHPNERQDKNVSEVFKLKKFFKFYKTYLLL